MPDTEQPPVADANADVQEAEQVEKNPAAPPKKRRLGPWLFLLLVFVGLPAAWLLSPPEFRQQAVELLNAGKVYLQTKQATQSASLPMTDTQPQTVETDTAQADPMAAVEDGAVEPPANTSDVESESPVDMAAPASLEPTPPVTDSTTSLQEEINRLQSELGDMQAEREQLTQQLKTNQVVELRVWLSLLASPDTRLSQRAGMWGYLASRPSLDESEQGKASEMAALLQHARAQLTSLRESLKQLAESIPDAQQIDIIPKPENPYLAWLIGAFHLRHAPSTIEQQQGGLRRQLLDMEHALSIEDWPEPRAWRQLLNAVRDQLNDSVDSGLSESMDDIRVNIDVSRKIASDWMEAL